MMKCLVELSCNRINHGTQLWSDSEVCCISMGYLLCATNNQQITALSWVVMVNSWRANNSSQIRSQNDTQYKCTVPCVCVCVLAVVCRRRLSPRTSCVPNSCLRSIITTMECVQSSQYWPPLAISNSNIPVRTSRYCSWRPSWTSTYQSSFPRWLPISTLCHPLHCLLALILRDTWHCLVRMFREPYT